MTVKSNSDTVHPCYSTLPNYTFIFVSSVRGIHWFRRSRAGCILHVGSAWIQIGEECSLSQASERKEREMREKQTDEQLQGEQRAGHRKKQPDGCEDVCLLAASPFPWATRSLVSQDAQSVQNRLAVMPALSKKCQNVNLTISIKTASKQVERKHF